MENINIDLSNFSLDEIGLILRIIPFWKAVPEVVSIVSKPGGIELRYEPQNYLFRVTGYFTFTMTKHEIHHLILMMHHAFLDEAEEIGIYQGPVMAYSDDVRDHLSHKYTPMIESKEIVLTAS